MIQHNKRKYEKPAMMLFSLASQTHLLQGSDTIKVFVSSAKKDDFEWNEEDYTTDEQW